MIDDRTISAISKKFERFANRDKYQNGVFWILKKAASRGGGSLIDENFDEGNPEDSLNYLLEVIEDEVILGTARKFNVYLYNNPNGGTSTDNFSVSVRSSRGGSSIGSMGGNAMINGMQYAGNLIAGSNSQYNRLLEKMHSDELKRKDERLEQMEQRLEEVENIQKSWMDKAMQLLQTKVGSRIAGMIVNKLFPSNTAPAAPAIAGMQQPKQQQQPKQKPPAAPPPKPKQDPKVGWINAGKCFATVFDNPIQVAKNLMRFIDHFPDEANTVLEGLAARVNEVPKEKQRFDSLKEVDQKAWIELLEPLNEVYPDPTALVLYVSIFANNFPTEIPVYLQIINAKLMTIK